MFTNKKERDRRWWDEACKMHGHEGTLRRSSYFCKLAIKVFFLARRTGAAAVLDEPMQTTLPEAVLPFFTRLLSRFFTFIVWHRLGFQKRVTSPRYRAKTDPLACTHSFVSRVQKKRRREREPYILEFRVRLRCKKPLLSFFSHGRNGPSPPPAFLEFYALPFAENPPIFVASLRPVVKEKLAEAALPSIFFPSHAHLTIPSFFFLIQSCNAEALHRRTLFSIRGVVPLKTKSSLRSKK